jgi:hypothetical protein
MTKTRVSAGAASSPPYNRGVMDGARVHWRQVAAGCAGLALAGVCAAQGPAASSASERRDYHVTRAYFDGREVDIKFVPASPARRRGLLPLRRADASFTFGPWQYGLQIHEAKPVEGRPNLYVVCPGDEHTSDTAPEFNHAVVLDSLAKSAAAKNDAAPEVRQWDVYWAVVLDPALRAEFRSERDLLLGAQQEFDAATLGDFEHVPGRAVLRDFLKVASLTALQRFRRKNGAWPRLLIVPARFSLRATASE